MPPPQGTPNPLEGPGDYTMTKTVHSDTYPAIDPATTANMTGHSVLIVGASKGIGKQMALSFARAGTSQIGIAARSDLSLVSEEVTQAAKEAGRSPPQVLPLKMDVTDRTSVEKAAEIVREEFDGKLDILINNAGVIKQMETISNSDPDLWWETMTTNLYGPYLTTRSFLPLHLRTLITISSVGAHLTLPSGSSYQISKLAVLRLSQFAAIENPSLISFAVHPGNILTDIVGRGENMEAGLKGAFTESERLCGDALVFLCKERREWLSGRYVNCTWDLPELCSEEKVKEIVEGDKLKIRLVV